MKIIKLQASNIAKLTGHNKYEPKQKTIDTILNFNKIKKIYIPKSNIEDKLSKMDNETLNLIRKELNLSNTTTIQDIEKIVNNLIMGQSYNKNINEETSKNLIDEKINNLEGLKQLNSEIKKDLQMKRGNIKEKNNLDIIEKKRNINIGNRNSKMYEKILYTEPNNIYQLIIRGKMDGITDNIIIETKNRTNKLFNHIPDYEKVQLECYMYLSGLNKALHIEHFNNNSNEIEYNHDEEFWNQCLINIIDFIDINIKPHF